MDRMDRCERERYLFFNRDMKRYRKLEEDFKEVMHENAKLRGKVDILAKENANLKAQLKEKTLKLEELSNSFPENENEKMAMEYDDDKETKRHPLLIHLVLDSVFKYLDAKSLRTSRLVCGIWNDVSLSFLRKIENPATFFGTNNHDQDRMLTLAEIYTINPKFPVVKIHFDMQFITLKNDFLLKRFLPASAPIIDELIFTLENDSRMDIANFGSGLHNFFNQDFTNLRNIEFRMNFRRFVDSGIGFFGNVAYRGEILSSITNGAPRLEKIVMYRSRSTNNIGNFEGTEELINALDKNPNLVNLKHLWFSIPICKTQIESLAKVNIQLESLSFDFSCVCNQYDYNRFRIPSNRPLKFRGRHQLEMYDEYEEELRHKLFKQIKEERNIEPIIFSVQRFLSHQSPFLKKLHLYYVKNDQFEALKTIRFHSLTSFKLERVESSELHVNFANNFPSLVELCLDFNAKEKTSEGFFTTTSSTCLKLQSLAIDYWIGNEVQSEINKPMLPLLNTNIIRTTDKLFPNLTKLKIRFRESLLRSIFQLLVNLEELEVACLDGEEEKIEPILTGIKSDICKQILSSQMITEENLISLQTDYSVANLKRLKTLNFTSITKTEEGEHWENWDSIGFSDITGYFLLYRMNQLVILTLLKTRMSKECEGKLYEKFAFKNISASDAQIVPI